MTQQVNLRYEYELQAQGYTAIAGLDEAGRGAWAGPVVAGAVILPMARFDLARALDGVNDSKQLAPQDRANLLPRILNVAVASGVGYASSTEIDQVGIVPATHRAMQRALAQLSIPPDALLIDSLCLPGNNLPCIAITKGDQKSLSIAAASILAKVTRDGMMNGFEETYPRYGFRQHKGYGTALHQQALQHFGPCAIHRLTFGPVQAALQKHTGEHDS